MVRLRIFGLGLLIGAVVLLALFIMESRAESNSSAYFPDALRHMAARYRYRQARAAAFSGERIVYLSRAARLDRDDPDIWSDLCQNMVRESVTGSNVLVCWRAVGLRGDAANNQALGVAYQAQGSYKQAAVAFSQAHQLEPGNPLTVSNLMTADLELQQYAQAVSVGEAFLAATAAAAPSKPVPYLEDIYAELGFAYQRLGRMREAEAAYAHTKFSGCTGIGDPMGKLDCKLRIPPEVE